ncbi:prepilin peptidase [Candidatus Woesebacteria bacterium]|nr:prepilin peptidase [Candidatus Woesebacteria bacterium]
MITLSFSVITTILFVFGTIIGSFLSVVILRSIAGENWVNGRSRCDSCRKTISWYDNIPLLSFLILRGKCRHCKKPILPLHPMVEMLTGVLFMWWYWGGFLFFKLTQAPYSVMQPLFWLTVGIILIYIFIMDLNYMIIPDKAVIALISLAVIYRLMLSISGIMQPMDLFKTIVAAVISCAFFFCLWFFTKGKGMGFGDVKLSIPLAILLGPQKTLVGMFLAFLIGAVVGIILVLLKKSKMKAAIPFGPFLIIGTIISLIWGDFIYSWYWTINML